MRIRARKKRLLLSLLVLLAGIPAAGFAQGGHEMPELDGALRSAIVDSIGTALLDNYVFADKAQEMDQKIHANLAAGDYDELRTPPELAQRLTEDLRSVCHDLHLGVGSSPPVQEYAPEDEEARRAEHEAWVAQMAANNFAFAKLEILPGNVGYLKLNGFNPADYGGQTAIAAMNFLAHTDAIIFDLRENGGGSPSMIQLISSYLFEEPVHLNSFYIRRTDEMKQFWTTAYVNGPRMTEQPVFVLTSPQTFSAAEEFSYNLKHLGRATLVGQTTGGGAHPVEEHHFNFEDFAIRMRVPYGRAINPVTQTNWEGTGVVPDREVPVKDALLVAHLEALTRLREANPDEAAMGRLEWAMKGIDLQLHPVQLGVEEMQSVVGDYGPRHVSLEDGALYYQRDERPRMRMIPMGEDWFALEDLDYFRIEFVRDGNGTVERLVGHYEGGRSDENLRDPSS